MVDLPAVKQARQPGIEQGNWIDRELDENIFQDIRLGRRLRALLGSWPALQANAAGPAIGPVGLWVKFPSGKSALRKLIHSDPIPESPDIKVLHDKSLQPDRFGARVKVIYGNHFESTGL